MEDIREQIGTESNIVERIAMQDLGNTFSHENDAV